MSEQTAQKPEPITRQELQVDYIAERLDELTQIVKRIEEKMDTKGE